MFILQIKARRLHADLPTPAQVIVPSKHKWKSAFCWACSNWAKNSRANSTGETWARHARELAKISQPMGKPRKQSNAAAHLIKRSPPLNLPRFLLYPANTLANFPFGRGKEIPLEPAVFLFPIWQINQSSRLAEFPLRIPLLQLSGFSRSYLPPWISF